MNINERNKLEVSDRLREIRSVLELTLEEMEQLSGFLAAEIQAMEIGQLKPDEVYLLFLLKRFRVNLNWIFCGHEPPFLDPSNQNSKPKYSEQMYVIKNHDNFQAHVASRKPTYGKRNTGILDKLLFTKKKEK